jgi:hypothetical protein
MSVTVSTYLPLTACEGRSVACGRPLSLHLRPKSADCEWGSGLWEGVMALYSSELAFNHLVHTRA